MASRVLLCKSKIYVLCFGFKIVSYHGVIVCCLCCTLMAFLQNMSPIMEKAIESCAFIKAIL